MINLSEKEKLTDEEFAALYNEYKTSGNIALRNRLVMAYSYIAQVSAFQLRGIADTTAQVEDMINQGIVTLIDCIDRYDISKGIRFESYAYMRVRGGIIDLIRKQDWIPRRVRVNAKEINRTASELANVLGREPTQQEIADKMGIDIQKLRKYNAEISNAAVYSFEELIQNVSQMGGALENSSADDITPERNLLREELRKVLKEAIENLSERERLVITLYYFENLNLSDISKVMEVSVQRVSQINTRAVTKLRDCLKDYLF